MVIFLFNLVYKARGQIRNQVFDNFLHNFSFFVLLKCLIPTYIFKSPFNAEFIYAVSCSPS